MTMDPISDTELLALEVAAGAADPMKDQSIQAYLDAKSVLIDRATTNTILALVARLRAAEQRVRDLEAALVLLTDAVTIYSGTREGAGPYTAVTMMRANGEARALLQQPEAAPGPWELTEEGGVWAR